MKQMKLRENETHERRTKKKNKTLVVESMRAVWFVKDDVELLCFKFVNVVGIARSSLVLLTTDVTVDDSPRLTTRPLVAA